MLAIHNGVNGTRDGLKRVYRTISKASSIATDLITSTNYDGLTTKTTSTQGNTTVLVSENTKTLGGLTGTYKSPDTDGDSETEISSSVTSYPAGGGTQTVNTAPDGTTTSSLSFADGDSKSSSDQEGHVSTFDKGTHSVNGSGLWSQTIAANGTQWTKSYSDPFGRPFKTEYADGAVKTMAYYPFNAALGSRGKLLTTTDPDENANPGTGSTATYFYNAEGEQIKTTTPLPGGNTLTQETETDVINSIAIKGTVIAPAVRSISKTNGITTSTSYRSVGGGEQIAASVTLSGESLAIQTRPTDGAWTNTNISPDGQESVQTYTQGRADKSEMFDNENNLIHSTTQSYGDLNRLISITDSRTGAVTYNGYLENGSVTSTTSNNGNDTIASIYDKMGRVITTTLPDNSTTHTSYTPRGQVKATWGSQTYARLNLYDALGRQSELRTYQDLAHGTEPIAATPDYAATQWIFSAQRGFLVEKNYHGETDDGTTDADYTYTASGRLKTRTWERGITTIYNYQNGQQTSIDYSDTTPDVTYIYDSFGRPSEIIQTNQAKHSFSYDPTKLVLTQETIEYDFNKDGTVDFTRTLDRSRDNLLRPTGFQLKNGASIETSAAYTFDNANRLSTVSDGTNTFTYAYLAQAPGLVQSVTGPAHTVTNTYEPHRNILIRKQNSVVSVPSVVSQFDYTSNSLGQRTALNTTGTAFTTANTINWAYNPAGEVINADHSNNTFDKSWNYDGIGNRKTATDSTGIITYTANPWNQYTAITGQPIGRTQDADGNLTTGTIPADLTANSTLSWDAENRLKKITKPNGDVIDFDYDYMSRRISKKVTAASIVTTHTAFVYDDWNPIGEYTVTANLTSTLTKSYLWGMDLSGSMQGAGGVGGLLAVKESPLPLGEGQGEGVTYYVTYDANGNISEYLTAAGTILAHYEYDAFGNTIVKTGALADSFAHRFSTKPLDEETGLYYYGYRYYDPVTGSWPSRDPIEEKGGINLYGFVGNQPTYYWDYLGLKACLCECDDSTPDLTDEANKLINDAVQKAFAFKGTSAKHVREKIYQELIKGSGISTGIEIELGKKAQACKGLKGTSKIAAAKLMKLCGECVGTDKLGHFLEQGLMYYDVAHTYKQGVKTAKVFGEWLEGASPEGITMAQYDFIVGGNRFDYTGGKQTMFPNFLTPNDGFGVYNDRGFDPKGGVSPADLAANEAGLKFWEKIYGAQYTGEKGKNAVGKINICDYVSGKWDQTQNPNVPNGVKPARPAK